MKNIKFLLLALLLGVSSMLVKAQDEKGTKSGVFYVVKQLPGNFGTLRFPTQHVVLVNTTRCVCHRGTLR